MGLVITSAISSFRPIGVPTLRRNAYWDAQGGRPASFLTAEPVRRAGQKLHSHGDRLSLYTNIEVSRKALKGRGNRAWGFNPRKEMTSEKAPWRGAVARKIETLQEQRPFRTPIVLAFVLGLKSECRTTQALLPCPSRAFIPMTFLTIWIQKIRRVHSMSFV